MIINIQRIIDKRGSRRKAKSLLKEEKRADERFHKEVSCSYWHVKFLLMPRIIEGSLVWLSAAEKMEDAYRLKKSIKLTSSSIKSISYSGN